MLDADKTTSGEAVRIARAVRGLTQRELANASGLPMWMIWQIEHGVRQAETDEWARIWSALTTE